MAGPALSSQHVAEIERLHAISVEIASLQELSHVMDRALDYCLELTASAFGFVGLMQGSDQMDVAAVRLRPACTGTESMIGDGRPVRVLLVDDHELVRAGLRSMLAGDSGIAVVGDAGTGAGAIGQAHALNPDVVLLGCAVARHAGRRGLPAFAGQLAWFTTLQPRVGGHSGVRLR